MNQIPNDPNRLDFNILELDEQIELKKVAEKRVQEHGHARIEFSKKFLDFKSKNKAEPEKPFPENEAKYFAIIDANFKYIGFLNKDLKKVDFGYNKYTNGDEYLGTWAMDNRTGNGIYIFNQENNVKEIYVGDLKNDGKISEGMYIWLESPCSIQNIANAKNFSVAVGNFNDDVLTDGKLIDFKDEKVSYYKGKLNNMMKDDPDAFLLEISDSSESAFRGTFTNNEMTKGRLVVFGDTEKSFYYTNTNGKEDFSYNEKNDLDLQIKKEFRDFKELKIKEIFSTILTNIMVIMRKTEHENAFKDIDYEADVHRVLRDLYAPLIHEGKKEHSEEKKEEEIKKKEIKEIPKKEEEKSQERVPVNNNPNPFTNTSSIQFNPTSHATTNSKPLFPSNNAPNPFGNHATGSQNLFPPGTPIF